MKTRPGGPSVFLRINENENFRETRGNNDPTFHNLATITVESLVFAFSFFPYV